MFSVFFLGKVEDRWVARITFQRHFSSTQHNMMRMFFPHLHTILNVAIHRQITPLVINQCVRAGIQVRSNQ